jgi:hypothetical protein
MLKCGLVAEFCLLVYRFLCFWERSRIFEHMGVNVLEALGHQDPQFRRRRSPLSASMS